MVRILLLPLDERPCNARFPTMMAQECGGDELIMPPRELLGDQKRPARVEAVAQWLKENFGSCDYAVISIDMLVYGGIVPSRLHQLGAEQCRARLGLLRQLHAEHPEVKVFAFSLILRAPAYNSAEEEPDYYETYGARLCRLGVLRDKRERGAASGAEAEELQALERALPAAVTEDFCGRRAVNHAVNERAVELLHENILDFLVIPLDDCAEYGWAAAEQRALRAEILQAGESGRAYLYSGADEVGCVLAARAVNHSRGRTPAVYLQYSSVYGPLATPKYEDRPLGENLKWQIAAAGGRTAASPEAADLILMVNAPTVGGEQMAEAGTKTALWDASYAGCRCLPDFVASLRAYLGEKPVALADLAAANGGDDELMRMLAREGLLPRLASYAAWNTAANAAGTCIAHAMLRAGAAGRSVFTAHRILEDWAYQADIRQRAAELAKNVRCTLDRGEGENQLAAFVQRELERYAARWTLPGPVYIERVEFPWHRFFEIDLSLKSAR